jgi:hypothetical protein
MRLDANVTNGKLVVLDVTGSRDLVQPKGAFYSSKEILKREILSTS